MVANTFLLSEISIYKKKYTRIRLTCQQFFKQDVDPLVTDPIVYLKLQNPDKLKLFSLLARFENYYLTQSIFPSQSWLAKQLGISRQYVNQLLGELVAEGFILSNYRHLKSCQYKLSRYFKDYSVRRALEHLIPSFKWISIALLTPVLLQAETFPNSLTTQIRSPFVFIKTTNHRISIIGSTLDCKRAEREQNRYSHRKKRTYVMKNPILPEIRHIPGVNFSLGQQIDLSEFPADAIVYAVKEFRHAKKVQNPFGWFKVVCIKYCEEHQLERNQSWVMQLKAAYANNPKPFSITDESPYPALLKDEQRKPVAKTYQAKYTAPEIPKKRVSDTELAYKKALERYKASKPADHFINRKTFNDEYTQKEILMELHKLEQYSTPEHMQPMIALLGEKAAYAYQARVKQDWLDKLASVAGPEIPVPPKTLDEIDLEYGPNYNDDSLYEEIIEEPIW